MARVFVAVWPPPAVRDALARLPRTDVPGVRWVAPEQLHATLRFLGHVDPAVVLERLATATLPPATADLGPAVAMLGRRVVMAPVAGLDAVAAAVAAATADLGRPVPQRPYRGHVTLARCRDDSGGRQVSGTPVAASFPVHEVVVASSETHADGARYTHLGTVPTTGT